MTLDVIISYSYGLTSPLALLFVIAATSSTAGRPINLSGTVEISQNGGVGLPLLRTIRYENRLIFFGMKTKVLHPRSSVRFIIC